MKLNPKQSKALRYLQDKETTELLYGGGAGGGKSILGCYWLIKSSLKYPGSRWLMGRSELKNLRETTFISFLKVAKMQELRANEHFFLTSPQDKENPNSIVFPNDSVILMKDLFSYPADPEFDGLGSLEITGAFIDEANQVTEKAKGIVRSRIRHEVEKNGLIPKLLMTCNPAKNWTYQQFYRPSKEGTIEYDKKFIQALVGDNPDIDANYRENLNRLDERSKQRLLYGNWEYDDDPSTLIEYDKIIDCFNNDFVVPGVRCITADIARFGSDKTVIGIWEGWRVKLYVYSGKTVVQVANIIKEAQSKFQIPNSQTICDEDGIGGGVVDILKCKGFVNNSMALPSPTSPRNEKGDLVRENYANLKSQCYYRLAERINNGGLYIDCKDVSMREMIIQELEQVKQYNMDKDGKKQILPKDKVKELIGRSPDFADTLMFREFFDLAPKRVFQDADY